MSKSQDPRADQGTSHPSMGRRAEEIATYEDEAGRTHTGSAGDTERPTGTSTGRYESGVNRRNR